jgi:hypothetical protein
MTDTDKRAEKVAGIRELAAWLEEHPEAPLPALYQVNAFPQNTDEGRQGQREAIAELRRVGAAVGIEPKQAGPHVEVRGPTFTGGISYAVVVCNARLEDFTEGDTCRCCGRPNEDPAPTDHCVCCTNDCGDRRGHVLDERQFVTPEVCVCGDVWPCEEAV